MSVDEVSILLLLLLRLFDMNEHMQACRAALCVSVFIAALSNNNHTQTHTLYYSKQKKQENCITYNFYIKELLNIFCLHFVVVVVCCYSRRLA